MNDVLISGYYGFANSGDEALLEAIIYSLKKQKPDISISVLSKNPDETSRHHGIRSIGRYCFVQMVKELKNSKLLAFK